MPKVYIYKRRSHITQREFSDLIFAHYNVSYMCILDCKNMIIIIADFVCIEELPSKVYTEYMNINELLNFMIKYIKKDNCIFMVDEKKNKEKIECASYLFPGTIIGPNIMKYWRAKINIYGNFGEHLYYDLLKDVKNAGLLKHMTCLCFYKEDLEESEEKSEDEAADESEIEFEDKAKVEPKYDSEDLAIALATARSEFDTINNKYLKLVKIQSLIEDKLKVLEKENATLDTERRHEADERLKAEAEYEAAANEILTLKSTISDMETDIKRKDDANKDLDNYVMVLRNDLRNSKTALESYKADAEDQSRKIDELEAELQKRTAVGFAESNDMDFDHRMKVVTMVICRKEIPKVICSLMSEMEPETASKFVNFMYDKNRSESKDQ